MEVFTLALAIAQFTFNIICSCKLQIVLIPMFLAAAFGLNEIHTVIVTAIATAIWIAYLLNALKNLLKK